MRWFLTGSAGNSTRKREMVEQYSAIAGYYDRLGDHIDYRRYADLVEREAGSFGIEKGSLALDVGCGTGVLTTLLAGRGYDMIGVDASDEMLNRAMDRARREKLDILWLAQDMRSFELYGTVKIITCTVDAFNYLLTVRDAESFLWSVRNYLEPGGLFIFDTNTKYKFETVFDGRDYLLEEDGVVLCWQNRYQRSSGICDFLLTVFTEQPDGSYLRKDERQKEKAWSERTIRSLLKKYDLTVVKCFGDLTGGKMTPDTERQFWICRRD